MQELDGALGMGRGGEDRPLVALQDFNPVCDVARVIRARLQGKAKVGSQESGSQFGHQLLASVSLIAPALAPEAPVQARGVTSPVQCLMPEGRVIALGIAEGGERGHADVIGRRGVEGLRAPMPDVGSGRGKERLRVGNRLGPGRAGEGASAGIAKASGKLSIWPTLNTV